MRIQNVLPINAEPPLAMAEWLNYPYSLTDKLTKKAGDVALQILFHDWALPSWWDKQVLAVFSDKVIHREIMMCANQEPCWYARTIIPEAAFKADSPFFDRLQHVSLGALIFNEPKIKRVSMAIYPINDQCIEYHWVHSRLSTQALVLWVRLREFRLNDMFPFFLIEIMLPALQRYSD